MGNKILKSLTIDGTTFDNIEILPNYSNSGSLNLPHKTQTKVDAYTFPTDGGRYIVIGSANCGYEANPSSNRWLEYYLKRNGSYSFIQGATQMATSNSKTYVQIPIYWEAQSAEGETIALNLFQASGVALTASWRINLMIIKVGGGNP